MRKDIRGLLKFLNEEILDKNQKLYKWQELWIETYLEQHTKEKANEKVSKRKDNKSDASRSRRIPDRRSSGACFREGRRGEDHCQQS